MQRLACCARYFFNSSTPDFSAMKLTKFILIAALAVSPLAVFADSRIGIGLNLNVPISSGPVVTEAPPPPAAEAIPPQPGPSFVWVSGHWTWKGPWRHWVWTRGYWANQPYSNARWVPGHWMQAATGGWVWIQGQWIVQQAPPPAAYPAPTQEVVVNQAPPPPVPEAIYAAPGPDYFWIGGYWGWQGRWIWNPGHYEHHHGGVWMAGRWEHRGGGYAWVGGHWR
jgi:hypothetical protein